MRPGIALTVDELADVVGGELTGDVGPPTRSRSGPQRVTIHSGHVEPGAVFVALAGRRDGHDFVAAAVANGAACAIVRRGWTAPDPSLPLVRVDDPLAALQALAAWYRAAPRRATSSPSSARSARRRRRTPSSPFLGESTFCYGSPGSFNSQLGVPLSVLGCPLDAELAVFEAAATEPGEMARLVAVLRPDTVVVTTVGDRFRRSFGSSTALRRRAVHARRHRRSRRVRRRRTTTSPPACRRARRR